MQLMTRRHTQTQLVLPKSGQKNSADKVKPVGVMQLVQLMLGLCDSPASSSCLASCSCCLSLGLLHLLLLLLHAGCLHHNTTSTVRLL